MSVNPNFKLAKSAYLSWWLAAYEMPSQAEAAGKTFTRIIMPERPV
jgi:hypothetical protein